jgi:hypothetical protein
MTDRMTKQEIKDQAQLNLLNDGAGAFLFVMENNIEPLEKWQRGGEEIDENELANEKAIYSEMEKQFDRMKKFLGWASFQGNH